VMLLIKCSCVPTKFRSACSSRSLHSVNAFKTGAHKAEVCTSLTIQAGQEERTSNIREQPNVGFGHRKQCLLGRNPERCVDRESNAATHYEHKVVKMKCQYPCLSVPKSFVSKIAVGILVMPLRMATNGVFKVAIIWFSLYSSAKKVKASSCFLFWASSTT